MTDVFSRAAEQRRRILMDYGKPEEVEFEVTEDEFRSLFGLHMYPSPTMEWPRLMGMPLRLHPAVQPPVVQDP